MEPFEVMTSESQERMLAIVEPGDLDEVLAICTRWEVAADVVGRVTTGGRLRILDGWDGEVLADVPASSLHDAAPLYDRPQERPPRPADHDADVDARPEDCGADLLGLLTDTAWVDVDRCFELMGITRAELHDPGKVAAGVRRVAERMPTYVTIKDVKRRWGKGQEDVFPVAQFEKLWGDMSLLPELQVDFHVVPRMRGQQLKDPAQLDGWVRDGSAAFVEGLCAFGDGTG